MRMGRKVGFAGPSCSSSQTQRCFFEKGENWETEELAPALYGFWWGWLVFLQELQHWPTEVMRNACLFHEMILQPYIWEWSIYFSLNTNRNKLLQISYNWMCGSVFWLDRETCRTQKEKKTENKQTRKAMSALKGSTFTTLARKQARAGHSPVWQREQLSTGEPGTSHLPANVDSKWGKLLTLPVGISQAPNTAGCMTKGKKAPQAHEDVPPPAKDLLFGV